MKTAGSTMVYFIWFLFALYAIAAILSLRKELTRKEPSQFLSGLEVFNLAAITMSIALCSFSYFYLAFEDLRVSFIAGSLFAFINHTTHQIIWILRWSKKG
jgi:hypothetical protein